MNGDERLTEVEIKLAFLEQQVAELSAALQQDARHQTALLERVTTLERALQVLATRVPRPKDDVANADEDPVPSSG
jgi:uncharacterized coiled-coil protein SlyX